MDGGLLTGTWMTEDSYMPQKAIPAWDMSDSWTINPEGSP